MKHKRWFSVLLIALATVLNSASTASAQDAGTTDPNGFTRYSIDGHAKAHGLRMQFKIPSRWLYKQGEHPHVVMDFIDPDHKTDMIIVQVRNLGEENQVALSDAKQFAQPKIAKKVLPDAAQITSAKRVDIDRWPALLVKGHMVLSTSDLRVAQDFRWIMFLFDHHLVQVGAAVQGLASQGFAPLEKRMTQNEPLFRAVESTIVLPDRWKNSSSYASTDPSDSNPSNQLAVLLALYGGKWWVVLLASLVITWGIGLTPPLLIRFAIARRPINKGVAIAITACFLIFNLVLFIALGSQSKSHGAVALIAFASYAILRKGAANQAKA